MSESNIYEKYKNQIIFEDDLAFAVHLKDDANSIGHIKIFPKEEITNFEDMSEENYVKIFTMASLGATLIWENAFNVESRGTTILMHSGEDGLNGESRAHFEAVLREPEDGVDTKWQASKEPDFSFVDKLKDETFIMMENEKQESETKDKKEETKKDDLIDIKKDDTDKKEEEKKTEEKKEVAKEKKEENKSDDVELKTPTQIYKDQIKKNQKLRNIERTP